MMISDWLFYLDKKPQKDQDTGDEGQDPGGNFRGCREGDL